MKAVILVGGKATRLLPLTCNIPKAIIPVLNTPFLEYVIRHLRRHQIKDIILAQGHLAQPIESYLGNGKRFGVKLRYVIEDTPRGTAGALKNTESYLDDTFLLLNGDIFTDLDITALIDFHRARKAKATIALTPVEDPTAYGLVETNTEGRVIRFLEKPRRSEVTTNMINAGIYVLEPDILPLIPPQKAVSIERETFQELLARREPVYAYASSAYWMDMGTPEKYLQLHRDLLSGKCHDYGLPPGKEMLIGEHTDIHPTAQLKGPVVIGNDCSIERHVKLTGLVVIGDGCHILEDSEIEDTIIWRNVRIGPRVHLTKTIIADNCCLNANSLCVESILGNNVTVVSGCKMQAGSRIWPESIVGSKT